MVPSGVRLRPALNRLRIGAGLLGPAFVAAIAYVDPGNVASNTQAGARYGYLLVWVVMLANLMASLVQYLSAKLGLVTGLSLPAALHPRMSTSWRLAYWAQAELVSMATDLAEVLGGAIALKLLFRLPLALGGLITGAVSMALLAVQSRAGQRPFERVITGMLVIIAIGFVAGLIASPPSGSAALSGLLPRFDGSESVLIAASILGATVMPHAIYLHSALARDRYGRAEGETLARLIGTTRYDVGIAMVVAGAVNLAIVLVAADSLRGLPGVDTIEGVQHAVSNTMGGVVGLMFTIGLLASGLASTSVGCYAGAVVLDGLLRRRIPLLLRRLVTLLPALALLLVGVDPTWSLLISQVMLSFGIPFALIPLVRLTSSRAVMGEHANRHATVLVGWGVTALIVALNLTLIVLSLTG